MPSTDYKFLDYIKTNTEVRPSVMVKALGISKAALHVHLRRLEKAGFIEKIGKPPIVFYRYKVKTISEVPKILDGEFKTTEKFIDSRYLYVSPSGEIINGIKGFWEWVVKTKQEKQFLFLANEYKKVRAEAENFVDKDGLIEATNKFSQTFGKMYIDKVFYQDFYSLPKFGKTKLGQLVLFAKQSQNLKMILQITEIIKPKILTLIAKYHIDAIAFVPPTVPRKIQFLQEVAAFLNLELPEIPLIKIYSGEVRVPQKTLSTLEERIINIEQTLVPLKQTGAKHRNVLIIDDAVGSGATLNETAKKIKVAGIVTGKIYGFAIVGSYKGFDVIREV